MSRINYQFLRLEHEYSTNFDYFRIYEQLEIFFITLGPGVEIVTMFLMLIQNSDKLGTS